MSRVIKVPEIKLNIMDNEGKIIGERNYFWLMIVEALALYAQKLGGIQLIDFGRLWKIIKAQNGQKTLTFEKEADWDEVKRIIEAHHGWIGSNAAEDGPTVIEAIRNAEKVSQRDKDKAK